MTLISDKEKTEVWQGAEDVESRSLKVLYSMQKTFDLCIDLNGPSVILANKLVAEACARLQNKGVKERFITEITKGNIDHCKEMMKIADLRDLGGIKGSFVIADGTDYAGVANTEEAQPITQLIVSNVRAFVEQQKYFLETQWSKAIPAQQRIIEIEEGEGALKPGIDPEIMPRLFMNFATKSTWGTGLGLFISKSIVEAHGGRIRGGNNKEGGGATMSFTLPAMQ